MGINVNLNVLGGQAVPCLQIKSLKQGSNLYITVVGALHINWGDGTEEDAVDETKGHTYEKEASYEVVFSNLNTTNIVISAVRTDFTFYQFFNLALLGQYYQLQVVLG